MKKMLLSMTIAAITVMTWATVVLASGGDGGF